MLVCALLCSALLLSGACGGGRQVKLLLRALPGVEVLDEIVLLRSLGSAPMRMGKHGVGGLLQPRVSTAVQRCR